jgi:hypothetical protein
MSSFFSRLTAFVDSMLGGAPAAGQSAGGNGEVPFNAFSGLMIFGYRRVDR